ncbi:MAG: glycosyltransferase family 9 protein [Pseudohongiellaceae bacterium]
MSLSTAPILLFPTHYLGNLVLGLPWVIRVLESHPDALVVLDARFASLAAMVLEADSNVLYYPRAQLAGRKPFFSRLRHYLRFLAALRRHRHRPLLDLEGERFTGVLAWLSGSAERVGPVGKHAERFYTRVLELDYHRHRFNAFGEVCAGFYQGAPPASALPFTVTEEIAASLAAKLPQLDTQARWVAIHPGASVDYKLWSQAYFVELVQRLQEQGMRVIWVGAGAMDAAIIAAIQSRLGDGATLSACDRLDLPELVALYRRCTCFIGSDSGPMHLAAATGMPVFALFGPSKESIWAPLGANSQVLRGSAPCADNCDAHYCEHAYRCLSSLLPAQVLAAVIEQGIATETMEITE